MFIIKRDGSTQEFMPYKIKDAIEKAFKSVNQTFDEIIYNNVLTTLKQKDVWTVEEIQDLIEKELFRAGYFEVMRSFMLYRHTRKLQREHILGLNDDTTYIDCTQAVEEYIYNKDWRVNANSNMGYSHAGLVNNLPERLLRTIGLIKYIAKKLVMPIEMVIFIYMTLIIFLDIVLVGV